MFGSYDDIITRIAEPPAWWDEHGAPRYGEFNAARVPNIYTEEAVLLEVECAVCGRRFLGELSAPVGTYNLLRRLVLENDLEYGPPPRHQCTGDAQESKTIRVVEYWRRSARNWVWERNNTLEREIVAPELTGA